MKGEALPKTLLFHQKNPFFIRLIHVIRVQIHSAMEHG